MKKGVNKTLSLPLVLQINVPKMSRFVYFIFKTIINHSWTSVITLHGSSLFFAAVTLDVKFFLTFSLATKYMT